jgi:hypothetical protein
VNAAETSTFLQLLRLSNGKLWEQIYDKLSFTFQRVLATYYTSYGSLETRLCEYVNSMQHLPNQGTAVNIFTSQHSQYLHITTLTISSRHNTHNIFTSQHSQYLHNTHNIFTSQHSQYLHVTTLTISSRHDTHNIFTSRYSQYLHVTTLTTSSHHNTHNIFTTLTISSRLGPACFDPVGSS